MTAEEAEAVAQFGAGQEEAEDEKRIKEVLAVTRGERYDLCSRLSFMCPPGIEPLVCTGGMGAEVSTNEVV